MSFQELFNSPYLAPGNTHQLQCYHLCEGYLFLANSFYLRKHLSEIGELNFVQDNIFDVMGKFLWTKLLNFTLAIRIEVTIS